MGPGAPVDTGAVGGAEREEVFFDAVLAWVETHVPVFGARAAVVLVARDRQDGLSALLGWPASDTDLPRFSAVIERAMQTRTTAQLAEAAQVRVAVPLGLERPVEMMLVLEFLAARRPASSQLALIEARAAHLLALYWHGRAGLETGRGAAARQALDFVRIMGERADLPASALALVNTLRQRFDLSRAALGTLESGGVADRWARVRVIAVSDMAHMRGTTRDAIALAELMEEAIDLEDSVCWPVADPDGADSPVPVVHSAYAGEHGTMVLSFPLWGPEAPVGALTVESLPGSALDAGIHATLAAIAEAIGPILHSKCQQHALLSGRFMTHLRGIGNNLLHRRRPSYVLGVTAICVLAALVWLPVPDRVSADATLFGAAQRAVTVPFDGYVAAVTAIAGDQVAEGDTLLRMEDEDLDLEISRWTGRYAQLVQERRVALAARDRSEIGLLDAQIAQAQAELSLARLKRSRAEITAPLTGLIVEGDLRQRIGAPVREGETLFQISPDTGFRMDIIVPEADISRVAAGQTGVVLLGAGGDIRLPFRVEAIRQTAETRDGLNGFVADATLDESWPGLRTGLEGLAKIDTGRGPAIVVWTRSLRHSLHRLLWAWMP